MLATSVCVSLQQVSCSGSFVAVGGGGIEHLEAVEAVCAWAHTLLAYTTILRCVNTF